MYSLKKVASDFWLSLKQDGLKGKNLAEFSTEYSNSFSLQVNLKL